MCANVSSGLRPSWSSVCLAEYPPAGDQKQRWVCFVRGSCFSVNSRFSDTPVGGAYAGSTRAMAACVKHAATANGGARERAVLDGSAVRCCGQSVEPISDPLHVPFTVDEVRKQVVDRQFVEERWLLVGPEFDVGSL